MLNGRLPFITICLFFNTLLGQQAASLPFEEPTKHQIELRHDNDFIVLTDRYYSFGLFLTYRHRLENTLLNSDSELLQFTMGEEAYTPDDTKTMDLSEMDRPYAGFLGLKSGWSAVLNNNLIEIDLLLGIAGKASGAGAIQRWYHNAVVVSDPQSWVGELANSFHTNLYAAYTHEWKLLPNPFGINLALRSEIAFGSRDSYLQPQAIAFFGRRNSMRSTIAYNRFGSLDREIFFSFSIGYRLVFYDGLLEGNAFGDDSVYVTPSEAGQLRIGFNFQHRKDKNEYRVGYRYNSEASMNTKSHQYIILAYARAF